MGRPGRAVGASGGNRGPGRRAGRSPYSKRSLFPAQPNHFSRGQPGGGGRHRHRQPRAGGEASHGRRFRSVGPREASAGYVLFHRDRAFRAARTSSTNAARVAITSAGKADTVRVALRTSSMVHTTSPVDAANKAQTHICKMTFMEWVATTRPGHRLPAGRVSWQSGSCSPIRSGWQTS